MNDTDLVYDLNSKGEVVFLRKKRRMVDQEGLERVKRDLNGMIDSVPFPMHIPTYRLGWFDFDFATFLIYIGIYIIGTVAQVLNWTS